MPATVQLLPEVIEPSIIVTWSGLFGLVAGLFAASRRFPQDRLVRVVLLGNLGGALFGVAILVLALVLEVLL